MITENEKEIEICISKNYEGKDYPFSMSCSLPIYFDFEQNRFVELSFSIKTPFFEKELKKGIWDQNNQAQNYYYVTFNLTMGSSKLVFLETPEKYQNKGFCTAALDLIKEVIAEYNSFVQLKTIPDSAGLKPIRYLYGEVSPSGNQALNKEQLSYFYNKNGFPNTNGIIEMHFD